MNLDIEFKTKTVGGEVLLVVEDRKRDAVSKAKYNKEDIARRKDITEQTAYVKSCGALDRKKLSFRYKG